MGIGVGITLLVVGLILVTGAVDVPDGVNDVVATDTVGWICVVVGALALVLAVLLTRQRSRSTRVVEEQRYDG
jgi:protein-S-isoprenylcysteine O-methyltransferase Ste14